MSEPGNERQAMKGGGVGQARDYTQSAFGGRLTVGRQPLELFI